jgi:Zn-finger protein
MLRTFLVFVFCSFFLCASDASAQQFLTTQSREVAWKCHGWVWIGDTNLFCADAKTDQLSKVGLDGSVVLPTKTGHLI